MPDIHTVTPSLSLRKKKDFSPLTLGHIHKAVVGVGIEWDFHCIHCALLVCNNRGQVSIEALEQRQGDFSKPETLIKNIKDCRESLPENGNEQWSCSAEGKYSYASQVKITAHSKSQEKELIQKAVQNQLPFDIELASLDYHKLENLTTQANQSHYIVAAIENGHLNNLINILQRCGVSQFKLDTKMLSLANSLYLLPGSIGQSKSQIVLHIGLTEAFILFESNYAPFFYHRFLLNTPSNKHSPEQHLEKMEIIVEEINNSVRFYQKENPGILLENIWLSGKNSHNPTFVKSLTEKISLKVHCMDLIDVLGFSLKEGTGDFNLAISLAMRGLE